MTTLLVVLVLAAFVLLLVARTVRHRALDWLVATCTAMRS